ncbi:MAG: YihY/virulence factor BrkB family protein [Treponemataceae bacterium]|nr:YihY/virulence factor BrkB family protein [Treponemataceae bacterium]
MGKKRTPFFNDKKFGFSTIGQSVYLSSKLFDQNGLAMASASCSFGFLFSFLPVVFLVIMVSLRFLHADQSFVRGLYEYVESFITQDQFDALISYVLDVKKFGILEISTVVVVFWIARRFFFSVMQAFRRIYNTQTKRKALSFNLWAFAGEVILVIGIALILVLVIVASSLIKNNTFLVNIFPQLSFWLEAWLSPVLVSIVPYVALCLTVTFVYRFAPGTKPEWKLCFMAGLLTTLFFLGFQWFFQLFFNRSRYTLIYGMLSTLIVLLLEIDTFFTIFMFFAQFVFVRQFFNTLVLGELYAMNGRSSNASPDWVTRILFADPERIVKVFTASRIVKGTPLCSAGIRTNWIYYIAEGRAKAQSAKGFYTIEKHSFVCEIPVLMNQPCTETIVAETELQVIPLSKKQFEEMLKTDRVVLKTALKRMEVASLELGD